MSLPGKSIFLIFCLTGSILWADDCLRWIRMRPGNAPQILKDPTGGDVPRAETVKVVFEDRSFELDRHCKNYLKDQVTASRAEDVDEIFPSLSEIGDIQDKLYQAAVAASGAAVLASEAETLKKPVSDASPGK